MENHNTRIEVLEEELSSFKGIIHVMLEEIELGPISDTARRAREAMKIGYSERN